MVWLPAAKLDVVNLALPVPSSATGAPSDVPPSENDTVPVGVLPEDGVTVAVKVTDSPVPEGFSDDASAVEVLALFTECANALAALPLKFESPL